MNGKINYLVAALCVVATLAIAAAGRAATDWTGDGGTAPTPAPAPSPGVDRLAVLQDQVPPAPGDPVRGSILDPVPRPVDEARAEVERYARLDAATTSARARRASAANCGTAAVVPQCYAAAPVYPVASAAPVYPVASAAPVRHRLGLLDRLRARRAAARAAAVCQPVRAHAVAPATCGSP